MADQEWGLWDEERERWVRCGYRTPGEAAAARREIERQMREDDDTNLQIVTVPTPPSVDTPLVTVDDSDL